MPATPMAGCLQPAKRLNWAPGSMKVRPLTSSLCLSLQCGQWAWSRATELDCGKGHHIPLWLGWAGLLKMLTCCLILPAATQWNKSGRSPTAGTPLCPDLQRLSFPPMSWGWRNGARHYRSLVLGLSSHTTKDRRPKILGSDWSTERTSPKYLQWLCLSYGKSLNPACGRGFLAKLPDWVLTKMESGQRKKNQMWLFVITMEGY